MMVPELIGNAESSSSARGAREVAGLLYAAVGGLSLAWLTATSRARRAGSSR